MIVPVSRDTKLENGSSENINKYQATIFAYKFVYTNHCLHTSRSQSTTRSALSSTGPFIQVVTVQTHC